MAIFKGVHLFQNYQFGYPALFGGTIHVLRQISEPSTAWFIGNPLLIPNSHAT